MQPSDFISCVDTPQVSVLRTTLEKCDNLINSEQMQEKTQQILPSPYDIK